MQHMPYERMVTEEDDETTSSQQPDIGEEAGRTPLSAEGPDGEERRTPQGEPGPTPGSAEGEDFDEPTRH